MITEFPHTITTSSGYVAEVTNPSDGEYHFEFSEPAGLPSFDWSQKSDEEKVTVAEPAEYLDIYQSEVLAVFQELMTPEQS